MAHITEQIRDTLSPNDEIVHHYRGRYNKSGSIIALSKEKFLFLHEQGLFTKHYNTILDLPYTQITQVTEVASHRFDITHNTTTYSIVTLDTPAAIVVDAVQHQIESTQPKTTTVKARTVKAATKPRRKK